MAENIIINKTQEEKEIIAQASRMAREEKSNYWDEGGFSYELGEYLRGSPFGC